MNVIGEEVVVFDGVSFARGNQRVLSNLNLGVRQGEVLGILGPSGCGKTTALKLINGLLRPSEGRIFVEGMPTSEWDPVRLRRRIGYVIQETGLFPHFTVRQNISLVPRLEGWGLERMSRRVAELMAALELEPALIDRYPDELSGGQRQRVGVARALAADPPILLMDEPFGALDPLIRLQVRRKFIELQRSLGTTTVFVTHDVQEAFELASRIGLLINGSLAELMTPEGFLHSELPEARAFVDCLNPMVRKD